MGAGSPERVLALIAREPGELATFLAEDDAELGFQWSFDRLRQFPVVRLDRDNLLVISPRLLFERVFGWLPIFDVVEGWSDRGDGARGQDALEFFRRVCEHQALDSLRAIAGGGRRSASTARSSSRRPLDRSARLPTRRSMQGPRGSLSKYRPGS